MGHIILAFMYLVAIGLLYRIIAFTITKNPKYKHEHSAVMKDIRIFTKTIAIRKAWGKAEFVKDERRLEYEK